MSKLDYLEITRNFKSYYQTLRDANYYLHSDSDVDNDKLKTTSIVLSKLILGFIRTDGTSFREMQSDQYEKDFQIFYNDFLSVIQNSGENNVDFDHFTSLIDEIIGIAIKRRNALEKIQKEKLGISEENEDELEEFENQLPDSTEQAIKAEVEEAMIGDEKVNTINKSNSVTVEEEINLTEDVLGSDDVEDIIDPFSNQDSDDSYGKYDGLNGNIDESDDNYRFRPKRKRFR
ncbi:hypothetical protein QE429_002658 [Bacillus sp. SORGH_AS 510]|uniref:hypothetical protein n=1 Tax=Bacillus sp. SORGH_AS_0510 TaxID=3041771 RepID=UPI00277F37A4|nr:hypothetical protein [Bacillus sp. SORGH_AS_0510]MDQ1145831.1 hypothetical protein [Bacillus sp. SORGH_AS_0510]